VRREREEFGIRIGVFCIGVLELASTSVGGVTSVVGEVGGAVLVFA